MARRFLGGVALALASFFSGQAGAIAIIPNGTPELVPVTGGWILKGGPASGAFVGRQFAAAASGGGVTSTEVGKYLVGASRSLTVTSTTAVTAAELASAAVAVGAAAYGGCAAGTAFAKWAGLGDAGGSRTGCNLTDWLVDPGQPPQQLQKYQVKDPTGNNIGPVFYGSQEAACQATVVHAWINNNYPGSYHSYRGDCKYDLYNNQTGAKFNTVQLTAPLSGSGTGLGCPASIDALDPAFSIPAGSAPGPDGLCATGRYTPVAPSVAQQRLAAYGKPAYAPGVAEVIQQKGGSIPAAADPNIVSVTPTSITGDPVVSTTTKPDGTVETVTRTPTTTYTPLGNTIKESTVQNTVVNSCVGTGACATTTTTTTTPKSATDVEQPKTDCDKNPEAIGCSKFGEPSSGERLTVRPVAVSVTPVSVASGGECPADRQFDVAGHTYTVSFGPVCDGTVTYVRPFVLLAGGLLAAWIFVGGFRS